MSKDLYWLGASTVLTWVMLLVASLLRTHGWTPAGMKLAFGNRDNLPAATALAGRADRAAKNMVENLVLLAALVLAAHLALATEGAAALPARVALGAMVFFWARLVYFGLYLAGVPVLRTVAWAVSVVGLALIGSVLVT